MLFQYYGVLIAIFSCIAYLFSSFFVGCSFDVAIKPVLSGS